MRALRALAACLLFAALPRPAAAEWLLTPLAGLTFANDTNFIDPELGHEKKRKFVGGAVTYLTPGIFGAEAIGVWIPGYFDNGGAVLDASGSMALMGNVVITAPRRLTEYSLRPFVSGGFGWLRLSQTSEHEDLSFDANIAGFNVGGGAVGFLTGGRVGLRFDVRYFSSMRPGDKAVVGLDEGDQVRLRYMTASIGIVFRR